MHVWVSMDVPMCICSNEQMFICSYMHKCTCANERMSIHATVHMSVWAYGLCISGEANAVRLVNGLQSHRCKPFVMANVLVLTKFLWVTLIVPFPLDNFQWTELWSELFTVCSVSFFYYSSEWMHILCVLLGFIGYSLFQAHSDHSPIPNNHGLLGEWTLVGNSWVWVLP